MMRKLVIGLAAAAIAMGGATLSASAYPGGGHGGGMGKPGGKYGMAPRGGRYGMGGKYGGVHRPGGLYRGGAYGYRGDWRRRHHHHWPRYGGWRRPYGYYGGGSCWRNVWTDYGWQRQYVCGPRPYRLGGGYYRHWRGPHYGQWGGGPRHWYGRR